MPNSRRPIYTDSLYRHARAVEADDGSVIFLNPERIPYEERDDTIPYTCKGNEYLWDIAYIHYGITFMGGMDLAEVVALFQPEPLQDLSLPPAAGVELLIPSLDYITEVAKGPSLAETVVL